MDTKYNQLFTASDVKQLVAWLTNGTAEGLDEEDYVDQLVANAEDDGALTLTFPVDEPLFLLRGQDALASEIIDAYIVTAEAVCGEKHIEKAREGLFAFSQFAENYPDRVKLP